MISAKQWHLSTTQVKRLRAKAERTTQEDTRADTLRKKNERKQKRAQCSRLEIGNEANKRSSAVIANEANHSSGLAMCLNLQPHEARYGNADYSTSRVEEPFKKSAKSVWQEFETGLES